MPRPRPTYQPRFEALESRTLLSAAAPDPTFGTAGRVVLNDGPLPETLSQVATQADGKIVTVGSQQKVVNDGSALTLGYWSFQVRRFNADGSPDRSFGSGGRVVTDFGSDSRGVAVALAPDGKIVVLGQVTDRAPAVGSGQDLALARYNPDGSPDVGFHGTGQVTLALPNTLSVWLRSVLVRADGSLAAVGSVTDNNFVSRLLLAGFGAAGDAAFTRPLAQTTTDAVLVAGVAPGPDGKVVLGGALGRPYQALLTRFNVTDASPVLAVGADAGGGPNVAVFSGKDNAVLYDFFAFDPRFTGGVRVAAGDTDGDGKADVIAAAGAGGGADVAIFRGSDGARFLHFFAYEQTFTGGVYVASADLTGDGLAEIITGPGAGRAPTVEVYDRSRAIPLIVGTGQEAPTIAAPTTFTAYDPAFTGGVRVGTVGLGNGKVAVATAPGPGGGPDVRRFDAAGAALDQFFALDPRFTGGLFVAGA